MGACCCSQISSCLVNKMPFQREQDWTQQRGHLIMFNSISWQTECFQPPGLRRLASARLKTPKPSPLSDGFTACFCDTCKHTMTFTHTNRSALFFLSFHTCLLISPPLSFPHTFNVLPPSHLSLQFLHLCSNQLLFRRYLCLSQFYLTLSCHHSCCFPLFLYFTFLSLSLSDLKLSLSLVHSLSLFI